MESEQWRYDELSEDIEAMCISKAEEFRLLGYEYVTGKDIWDCISRNYAKEEDLPCTGWSMTFIHSSQAVI